MGNKLIATQKLLKSKLFIELRKMGLNLSMLCLPSGHMVFNSDQMKNCLDVIKLALIIGYNWTINYLGFLASN